MDLREAEVVSQVYGHAAQVKVVEEGIGDTPPREPVWLALVGKVCLHIAELLVEFADILETSGHGLSLALDGVEEAVDSGFENGHAEVRWVEEGSGRGGAFPAEEVVVGVF